ncbi:MAG: hypothetical protein O3C63_02760 [Cyanobacteria bacterium]|nr:hypothetical protein [Cyanobacteriota bacterium]MDA1020072.1 hypothetical protein [Cyanobacteriota bacterium]
MAAEEQEPKEKPVVDEVDLRHKYVYVGGHYAYKNSSKKATRLDPNNLKQLILMARPGQASAVNISMPSDDERAGVHPQHNTVVPYDEDGFELSASFISSMELIPSRTMLPYHNLATLKDLKQSNFEEHICSLTKQRLDKVKSQFSHLSEFAFNQMLNIPRPDKRDFSVWVKKIEKSNQVIIAFPATKSRKTIFAQVIQYTDENHILGIKHCSFSESEPLVINESFIDTFGNYRQIAHLGPKGKSEYLNSVERFDDGSVSWIVSYQGENGAAVLRPNGEISFVENMINHAAHIAARNLGAEGVEDGTWTGEFDELACQPDANVMQEVFKDKVRSQIGQIIDGAAIPGLDPIFWVEL